MENLLPLAQIFHQPKAALRRISQDPPPAAILAIFVGVQLAAACVNPLTAPGNARLAKLVEHLPFLALPGAVPAILFGLNLLSTAAWSLCAHLAARLIGGKASGMNFFVLNLFLAAVAGLLTIILRHVPLPLSVIMPIIIGLWRIMLSLAAISAHYEFSLGNALAAYVLGWAAQLFLFLIIGAGGAWGLNFNPKVLESTLQAPAMAPDRAPMDYDWSLESLDGKPFAMAETKGKVVFLNFWGTRCFPCLLEMPSIQRLHEKVKDEGILVLCVSEEDPGRVREFVMSKNYALPVYTLPGDRPAALRSLGIPVTFIISPEGFIVAKKVGSALWDSEESVRYLRSLRSPAAAPSRSTSAATASSAFPKARL